MIPISAIAKPLSAPSSAPISIARAVPMPCAADPSANPCAIGSVTPQRRSSQGPTRLPKIPTQKTTTEVIVMMPPSGSATDTAIGTVTDFGRLMNPNQKEEFVKKLSNKYQQLREKNQEKQVETVSLEEAKANRLNLF